MVLFFSYVGFFVGIGLTMFGFIKVKKIYFKAGAISMGTLAMGISIYIFAWTNWGYFPFHPGPDTSFFLMAILTWPVMILNIIEIGIFGDDLFGSDYEYLEWFHFAVAQYLGYLGLLFLIRWLKKLKATS